MIPLAIASGIIFLLNFPSLLPCCRYYESKFGVLPNDVEFRHQVAREYTLGLCWVLRYYYQVHPLCSWVF